MNNRFGNERNDDDARDRDRDDDWNEDRNMWSGREEDGGFARSRSDESFRARNRGDESFPGRNREPGVRGQQWGGSGEAGAGQRGYGRGIYGESGLGERQRNELHHGLGAGGYAPRSSSSGRGSASYGGGSSGYAGGSSGYTGGSSDYVQGSLSYGGSGNYGRPGEYRYDQGSRSRDFGGGGGGGGYAGRGPKGYTRADERIREDVCDRLSQDDDVDASDISVRVQSGEVTLEGTTENRRQKHLAEEIAADVPGVNDVHNNVRVRKGVLTELKEKITGDDQNEQHYAGGGTKTTRDERQNGDQNRL